MRLRNFWLLLFFIAVVASAQNPQTQTAPIYAVNAKYTNGVAPGYAPTAGSGLNLTLGQGTANCAGTIITYTGGTLALTASTTNYVYLNTTSSCAPAVKTSAFVAADIPVAVVVASGSGITSITDDRTFFNVPGTGVGIANVTITTGTGAISLTCSSNSLSSAVTMTGLTTSNTLTFTPTSDLSSVAGWENGDIFFVPVLGSGSFQWRLCTTNSSGETPGGSVIWNVSGK